MVLDFLRLVGVANRHLLGPHPLIFFFQSLLFISEDLKGHHDFFDLVFSLRKHILHLSVVVMETFSLVPAVLLVASSLLNLPIFDLDQLSQILILFLQGFVF